LIRKQIHRGGIRSVTSVVIAGTILAIALARGNLFLKAPSVPS